MRDSQQHISKPSKKTEESLKKITETLSRVGIRLLITGKEADVRTTPDPISMVRNDCILRVKEHRSIIPQGWKGEETDCCRPGCWPSLRVSYLGEERRPSAEGLGLLPSFKCGHHLGLSIIKPGLSPRPAVTVQHKHPVSKKTRSFGLMAFRLHNPQNMAAWHIEYFQVKEFEK